MLPAAIILDTIWCHRNTLVHTGQGMDLWELVRSVRRRYASHKEAWGNIVSHTPAQWTLPQEGTIKINFDVAVQDNWFCIAVVSRTSRGEIQGTNKNRGLDPLKGEGRAASEPGWPLPLLKTMEIDIIIEGDSLTLVEQFVNVECIPDSLIEEVTTMRLLLQVHTRWKLQWTLRERNILAHSIAQWGWSHDRHGDFNPEDVPCHIVFDDDSAVSSSKMYSE